MVDFRINYGEDYNFYKKITVNNAGFGDPNDGYRPDAFIKFTTQTVMFLNENATKIVEYSFNGFDVHGELDPTLPSRAMTFDNRVICKIWFRYKSGSSAGALVRVDAWGTH